MKTFATHGASVSVDDISLSIDGSEILSEVSVHATPGEFVALVGPSGAGKSSLLKVIGGHQRATTGRVMFGGQDVSDQPAEKRSSATVFQHHGLFPHMSVFDNVAFGLRVQRASRGYISERVAEMLELVGLAAFGERKVVSLSGGESQRVATARALAVNPPVLLMDEPLAALDRRVKERIRAELKNIVSAVGVTTLYVTHDQEEALMLADQVVVMEGGRVVQADTPVTVYRNPNSTRVADFLGSANILQGAPALEHEHAGFVVDSCFIPIEQPPTEWSAGRCVVRQEDVILEQDLSERGAAAVVQQVEFMGPWTRYRVRLGNARGDLLVSLRQGEPFVGAGDEVRVRFRRAVVCPEC